jgi:hypothetical protein
VNESTAIDEIVALTRVYRAVIERYFQTLG